MIVRIGTGDRYVGVATPYNHLIYHFAVRKESKSRFLTILAIHGPRTMVRYHCFIFRYFITDPRILQAPLTILKEARSLSAQMVTPSYGLVQTEGSSCHNIHPRSRRYRLFLPPPPPSPQIKITTQYSTALPDPASIFPQMEQRHSASLRAALDLLPPP